MRQAGMKPKNHSSGVYWVRANANSGSSSQPDVNEIEVSDKWTYLGYLIGLIIAVINFIDPL